MNSAQLIQPNIDVENLLSEVGMPCISIIMPTHRLSPARRIDKDMVNKLIVQAEVALQKVHQNENFDLEGIAKRLNEIGETIDYTHVKDGIGIYVSANVSKIVKFPFPVRTKVKVGNTFDSRDLLYYKENIIFYLVLTISKKYIHLYQGEGEKLIEIIDDNFPINYVESYEYAKPNRSNSFASNASKDFERDKSILHEVRLVDFLRKADHILEEYISGNIPLVISGGKKEMADYLKITIYKNRIIGKITGNYGFDGDTQLAILSWSSVQEHLDRKREQQVKNLDKLIGKKKLAIGLEEVWQAASAGNCYELFVEKDFEDHAFLINEKRELRLNKPASTSKHVFVPDVVERIIKMVKEKKGKITFTKNGSIPDFNGIALQLRYNHSKNISISYS